MVNATCIKKIKDSKNVIVQYRLRDSAGVTLAVTPDQLKWAIKNNKVAVDNLTLTSDNRLVDSSKSKSTESVSKSTSNKSSKINVVCESKVIANNEIIGYKCFESNTENIIYIRQRDVDNYNILDINSAPINKFGDIYARNEELMCLSRQAKIQYCDSKLFAKSLIEKFFFTIDELEALLEWNINLEMLDNGSSGFDIIYERNPNQFRSITNIKLICKTKGLLTENQFDKYIIGLDKKHNRICNVYSFADWILYNRRK